VTRRIHLDHNSTTPQRPEARARFLEVLELGLGNPSSLHAPGRRARACVDDARARAAAALGVHEDEIFFTSGATEANNLALFGVLEARGARAGLVTTTVEHSSVLAPARRLAARGHPLGMASVDAEGLPDAEELRELARAPGTALLSVGAANNETGATPDLANLAASLPSVGGGRALLHSDAVQAIGRIPFRPMDLGLDLASLSGHKFGAGLGAGILWKRRGVALEPRAFGGGQELDLRPGTENVPAIAACALALELAVEEQASFARRSAALARELWRGLVVRIPGVRLIGPPLDSPRRLPNTLCVLVPGTDGKVLVTRLDLAGLEVSAGSACASGSVEPSHVLVALGLARDEARSGLRLSLGRNTSEEDCKHALAVFHEEFSSSRAT
jgi:cysteine desulfurase